VRRAWFRAIFSLAVFAAVVGGGVCGCAKNGRGGRDGSSPFTSDTTLARLDPTVVRAELFAFIDSYGALIEQPSDRLIANTSRREVATWTLRNKITSGTVLLSDAAAANPLGGMLDSIVYVSLDRAAIEEHWVPTLLHEEGKPLLDAARQGEAEAWDMAGKFLTPGQVTELRTLIDQWRKTHPDQYYVGQMRFADLSTFRQYGLDPASVKPGSVFSLLYINPLPSLDPVADELRQYRMLTERLAFVMVRMPTLLSWRVEAALNLAADLPQADRVVASTTQLSGAADRLVDVFAKYPNDLTAERKAAIEQWFVGMDAQRQAIQKELDSQHSQLGATLTEARHTIADARAAADSITNSANQTAQSLRRDSEQLVALTTRSIILLIVAASVIPVAAMLLYRWLSRRMVAGNHSPPGTPR